MPIEVLTGAKGQQVLYPTRFNLLACESGITVFILIKLKRIITMEKIMVSAFTGIVSSPFLRFFYLGAFGCCVTGKSGKRLVAWVGDGFDPVSLLPEGATVGFLERTMVFSDSSQQF